MEQQVNEQRTLIILQPMIDNLRTIRTWTRFVAICGFIGTAIMVLAGIAMSISAMMVGAVSGGKGMPPWIGLFYIIAASLYGIPSWYLLRSSASMELYLRSQKEQDLGISFSRQASFWRIIGIMVIIVFVLSALGMIAAITVPLALKAFGK